MLQFLLQHGVQHSRSMKPAAGRQHSLLDPGRRQVEDEPMAKPPTSSPPRPAGGGSTGGKGAERCAFCGRREIEAGRLIAGAKAAICADCIRRLGEGLKAERGRRPPR